MEFLHSIQDFCAGGFKFSTSFEIFVSVVLILCRLDEGYTSLTSFAQAWDFRTTEIDTSRIVQTHHRLHFYN